MRPLGWLGFTLLLSGVVSCDHATKHLATQRLDEPVALVPGVLDLTYARNTDTAFSLIGERLPDAARWWLLTGLSTLVTIALIVVVVRRFRQATTLERVLGALILGGAVGNVTDRLLRGHVVDFIHLHHWPVFNVADVAICAGILLFLVAHRPQRAPPTAAAS